MTRFRLRRIIYVAQFALQLVAFSSFSVASEANATVATNPPASLGEPLQNWCSNLSKQLKSVERERCNNRPWKYESSTDGGRPIPYVFWGKSESEKPARRILILGAIHGDEISAVSMVFRWLDFMDRTKSDSFLRENRYMFFPLVNPDGFYSSPRTRTNKAGVDLNRNFSTKEWTATAASFWKKKAGADPRRFPGQKPASERETQVVEKAIEEFKPDLIISVHAPYRLVDHDGPILFPDLSSPLPVRALGAFPGSLGTYAGIERNIPVVTPELPNAKVLPDHKAVIDLLLFIMKSKY